LIAESTLATFKVVVKIPGKPDVQASLSHGMNTSLFVPCNTIVTICEQDIPKGYKPEAECVEVDTGACPSKPIIIRNKPGFDLIIKKSASKDNPCFNEPFKYYYKVTNVGPAAVPIYVTDDKCSPVVLVNGDDNHDGLIQNKETWEYECKAIVRAPLEITDCATWRVKNTATVRVADKLTGWVDLNPSDNTATYEVFPCPCMDPVPPYSCPPETWIIYCLWPAPFNTLMPIAAIFKSSQIDASVTLFDALGLVGDSTTATGAVNRLVKAATAAVLNQARFGVGFTAYPVIETLVVNVNNALKMNNLAQLNALSDLLESANVMHDCPLEPCDMIGA
jgi:hypothetical protein